METPRSPIRLSDLLAEIPVKVLSAYPGDAVIQGIAIDNRQMQPGDLFVAMRGGSADGHDFIGNAIARGAAAVAGDRPLTGLDVPYLQFENSRASLTWLAAAFYGYPARKLTVIGVTGTDGKTTTCNLIFHLLKEAGLQAGLISTVNAVIGNNVLDTGFHVTTPDAHDVQRYLARMVEDGLTHVVLETTSHGWAQHRVDACEFDIGVVTNITHEHLDEHGSYDNYRAAKARLFQSLARTLPKAQGNIRLAVLNRDDSSYDYLASVAGHPQISYGLSPAADLRAEELSYQNGIQYTLRGEDLNLPVWCRLTGEYNVSNSLAALAATICGLEIDARMALRGLAKMETIPGRWEKIELGQNFTAVVDFAHTPNALKVVIESARKLQPKRVIVIFGSAGLRDRQKRRMMSQIGAQLADITILTAEDPRTESLADILEEMADGARSSGGVEGETFWRVPDRGEAMRKGVQMAEAGDIVIACGKGHEQSMCFEQIEYPWDDRTAMRAAISELMRIAGPAMPVLPTSRP